MMAALFIVGLLLTLVSLVEFTLYLFGKHEPNRKTVAFYMFFTTMVLLENTINAYTKMGN